MPAESIEEAGVAPATFAWLDSCLFYVFLFLLLWLILPIKSTVLSCASACEV